MSGSYADDSFDKKKLITFEVYVFCVPMLRDGNVKCVTNVHDCVSMYKVGTIHRQKGARLSSIDAIDGENSLANKTGQRG